MLKIILFIDSLGPGGAEKQIVELAKGLKQIGHDVKVCIYRPRYEFKYELDNNKIELYEIKRDKKSVIRFIFDVVKMIKNSKPDYIVSYKTYPNLYMLLSAKIAGFKNVIVSERNIDLQFSKLKLFLTRFFYRDSKYVVANSKSASDMLTGKKMKLNHDKVKVIYNGVNTKRLNRQDNIKVSSDILIQSDCINIAIVGRVESQKNHQLLIRAMDFLVKKYRNVKLYCVGNVNDRELYNELISLVSNLGLNQHITFVGHIDDVQYVYRNMDIIVLPSLYEGFPNVMLEAMYCRSIVVVSDVSDNSIIVKDGYNGFIFENNNLDQLINKLEIAINMNENQKGIIKNNAHDTIEGKFTVKALAKGYLSLMTNNAI